MCRFLLLIRQHTIVIKYYNCRTSFFLFCLMRYTVILLRWWSKIFAKIPKFIKMECSSGIILPIFKFIIRALVKCNWETIFLEECDIYITKDFEETRHVTLFNLPHFKKDIWKLTLYFGQIMIFVLDKHNRWIFAFRKVYCIQFGDTFLVHHHKKNTEELRLLKKMHHLLIK